MRPGSSGRRQDGSRGRMIPGANHDMPRSMIDEAMTDRIMRVVFRDKLVHQRGHAPGYAWANPDDLANEQCARHRTGAGRRPRGTGIPKRDIPSIGG